MSGTFSELFGLSPGISSRIVIFIVLVVQMLWAYLGIKSGGVDVAVAFWVGIVYFGVSFANAVITVILQGKKIMDDTQTSSKILNMVVVGIKVIQLLISGIFGVMFLFSATTSTTTENETTSFTIKLYAVLIIAALEMVTQGMSMMGVI